MPQFNESVVVAAPREPLWELLRDPVTLVADFRGVEHVAVEPAQQPLDLNSQTSIKLKKVPGLVVARVTGYSRHDFVMQSEIVDGPFELHGHLGLQLRGAESQHSLLALSGVLDSRGMRGAVAVAAFLVGLSFGMPSLGEKLAQRATGLEP